MGSKLLMAVSWEAPQGCWQEALILLHGDLVMQLLGLPHGMGPGFQEGESKNN